MVVAMRVAVIVAVIVAVRMILSMAVAVAMTVGMTVMVVVAKSHHTDQVNGKAHAADNEQLSQALRLRSLPKAFERLESDFDTQQPVVH